MGFRKALRNANLRQLIAHSWSVSWPLSVIMFLVFVIGLCDVYAAGKFGKEVQAAYGLAFQVYFIFSIIASALTVGTVSMTARLFSAGRTEDLRDAVDSSFIMTLLAGVVFSAAAFALSRVIISRFTAPDSLKDTAVALMRIYAVGMPFNYLLLNTNGVMRSCGMIKRSLGTMAVVCAANVLLIFALAFHTGLGFKGIGIATVVSAVIGTALNIAYLRSLTAGRIRFNADIARRIAAIGWPAGILQILWHAGTMVLYLIVSRLPEHNVEIMAAFTNGLRIESAIFLPAFAFNMSNAVVVGNLIGRRRPDDAFSGGVVTALTGVLIVAVMTVFVLLNAHAIAGRLSSDPVVVRQCVTYISISLILEPLMAWGVILGGGLNGAGDTRSVMVIIAFSVWCVRLPAAYLGGLVLGKGAPAMWWAMNASIIVQSILISRQYFMKRWLAQGTKEVLEQWTQQKRSP